ncbi:restriction endonuclease subunit S [Deinococcus marmoris]|nr:restriction endonuclease subunit S [Deinococcus marmoris]
MKSKRVPIGKLGTLSQGVTLTRYTSDGGQERRVLQVTNLTGIHVEPKDGDRFEKFDDVRIADFLARTGQILIALRTSSLKASVVPDGLNDAVISNNLTVLDVDRAIAHPYFVAGLLRSELMQRVVAPMFTGSVIQNIPLAKFKTLEIVLPDLTEQDAIAEAIAAQDVYRVQTHRVTELMSERIEAALRPFVISRKS